MPIVTPETYAAMLDAARSAHALAHEWCFIANSVAFEVHIEPETLMARPTPE